MTAIYRAMGIKLALKPEDKAEGGAPKWEQKMDLK